MVPPHMPRVTSSLVGADRFRNDAFVHALVIHEVPCDDAVVMLLDERDRLIKELIYLRNTQPTFRIPYG